MKVQLDKAAHDKWDWHRMIFNTDSTVKQHSATTAAAAGHVTAAAAPQQDADALQGTLGAETPAGR